MIDQVFDFEDLDVESFPQRIFFNQLSCSTQLNRPVFEIADRGNDGACYFLLEPTGCLRQVVGGTRKS